MGSLLRALLAKSAFVISAVVLLLAFIPSHPTVVQGQGQRPATPVEILKPLPLPVQGSVSVTGSVAVTNKPTVNVENWISKEPFKATCEITIPHIENHFVGGAHGFFVPSGKRLVIEHVSASVGDEQGGKITELNICTRTANLSDYLSQHYLVLSSPVLTVQRLSDGTDLAIEYRTASQPVRLYADGVSGLPGYEGAQVIVGAVVFADESGRNTYVRVTISGYLAEIP